MARCIVCGSSTEKRYRSYLKQKYCLSCWEKFQNDNKDKLKEWSDSNNVVSLDNYPDLKDRGYYIESDGTIWITKIMSRETLQGDPNVYLPEPIQYHIPTNSAKTKYFNSLYYGDHGVIPIRNLVYYAFKGPFDLDKYVIINKDKDTSNNNIDNLLKIPKFLVEPMFYALKKGIILASAPTLERLAAIIKESYEHVSTLYNNKVTDNRGIYILSQNELLRLFSKKQ